MANYSKPKHHHHLKGTYSSGTKRPEPESEHEELEASWCGCFGLRSHHHKYNNHQETGVFLKQNDENGNCKESWKVSELKNNLKEFSEGSRKGGNWRRSKEKIQCVYSPESYALNFDRPGEEEEEGFISFRSRCSRTL